MGTQNVEGWSFVKMTESHIEIQNSLEQKQQNPDKMNPNSGGIQNQNQGHFSMAGNS